MVIQLKIYAVFVKLVILLTVSEDVYNKKAKMLYLINSSAIKNSTANDSNVLHDYLINEFIVDTAGIRNFFNFFVI